MLEKKLKHLELIQGVINRMANCSFLLKGWSVTIVAGLLALSTATQEKIALISIAFIPVIVFWILDSYYLWQERLFREAYNKVRSKDENEIDFDMNTSEFVGGRNSWFVAFFSRTILIFHLSLVVVMIGVLIFLLV